MNGRIEIYRHMFLAMGVIAGMLVAPAIASPDEPVPAREANSPDVRAQESERTQNSSEEPLSAPLRWIRDQEQKPAEGAPEKAEPPRNPGPPSQDGAQGQPPAGETRNPPAAGDPPDPDEVLLEAAAALGDPDPAKRVRAERILAERLAEGRPLLAKAASSSSRLERVYAAKILGEHGDPQDVPVIVGLLQDPDPPVRLAAIMALKRLRAKDAAGAVARVMEREPEKNIRKMAAKTLEVLGDPSVIGILIAQLERERDRGTRGFIVRALGRLSGKDLGDDLAAWKDWYANRVQEMESNEALMQKTW